MAVKFNIFSTKTVVLTLIGLFYVSIIFSNIFGITEGMESNEMKENISSIEKEEEKNKNIETLVGSKKRSKNAMLQNKKKSELKK